MTSRKHIALGVASLGLAGALGYAVRAVASGIPTSNTLTYSGVLEDANGPISGTHAIQVVLYDAATAGNNLCQTANTPTSVAGGHFSLGLPSSCTSAVGATCTAGVCSGGSPNVWIDVLVDRNDMGRSQIGAVPYAIEANHTRNADTATTANAAGGTLATQIAALQQAVNSLQLEQHPASAFRASLSSRSPGAFGQPNGPLVDVVFDNVNYDLSTIGPDGGTVAGEYDTSNGTFTPRNDGVYLLSCSLEPTSAAGSFDLATVLVVNGSPVANADLDVEWENASMVSTTTVAQIAAGQHVQCTFWENADTPIVLWASDYRTFFSATRLY